MSTAVAVGESRTRAARRSRIDHRVAARLAGEEFDRLVALLRSLAPDDWHRPTPCPDWDVHAMVCHIVGSAEMAASPLEQVRQMRGARRCGGCFLDALTALQVDKHVRRSPQEVLDRLARIAPRSVRSRRRIPAPLRRVSLGQQPVESTGAETEPWSLGYLTDVILTRDTFIHRSDISIAVGRDMVLTADHDGVLVADIAAEWAERHGEPCSLTLTGPAGGSWAFGGGGPEHRLDAVEFCRILSGRGEGEGLLATKVPF